MEVTAASVLLLPFAAASVGVARRRLVSDLIAADVYDSAVCDVALVISELFSNALRHAAPLPGAKIRVAWRIDPGYVQVSVSDGGGPTVPELGQPTQGATGGRGLRIVEKLSTRWGTSSAPGLLSMTPRTFAYWPGRSRLPGLGNSAIRVMLPVFTSINFCDLCC